MWRSPARLRGLALLHDNIGGAPLASPPRETLIAMVDPTVQC